MLDGKQRLLSPLKFTSKGEAADEAFALSGLQARSDLARVRFPQLEEDLTLEREYELALQFYHQDSHY